MKKVTDFLKPNVLIILGALLFLYYFNLISGNGATLARGIIAVSCACYYLSIGILDIVIGNKFSQNTRKLFDIISVCLFPLFMFVLFLIQTIEGAKNMGPTAWIIAIFSLIASLSLAVFYLLSKLVDKSIIQLLSLLLAAIFGLVLLLNILFTRRGNSIVLGNIDVILVVIYLAYLFYLFNSFKKEDSKAEAKE